MKNPDSILPWYQFGWSPLHCQDWRAGPHDPYISPSSSTHCTKQSRPAYMLSVGAWESNDNHTSSKCESCPEGPWTQSNTCLLNVPLSNITAVGSCCLPFERGAIRWQAQERWPALFVYLTLSSDSLNNKPRLICSQGEIIQCRSHVEWLEHYLSHLVHGMKDFSEE